MLSKTIDPEQLEDSFLSNSHYHALDPETNEIIAHNKHRIPQKGFSDEATFNLIHNDLTLDGNPTLNLASFVNTFVTERAKEIASNNNTKNIADADEYPTLIDMTARNVSILGKLWGADDGKAVGTATTGSSEAIMLGGLALKKRWQKKQKAAGKSTENPNIIMGANAQVALEKFARYFDVECRLVPVSEESNHVLDVTKVEENVDENTIGIFVILGSTYTGTFENVLAVSDLLDDIQERKGLDVPIHVDGASGAFVAPFVYPDLKWDFRLPRVHSINTSGHKFGLTTVGLGWIIWRDSSFLPEELIFKLRYLGSVEESYNLNFSRPGFQSIHQYFNFLSLGYEGYRKIHQTSLKNARLLSNFLEKSSYFEVVSIIHRKEGDLKYDQSKIESNLNDQGNDDSFFNKGLPVVAFKFTAEFQKEYPNIPQALVSTLLREKGWIIPNYPLPANEEETEILRVVVRQELQNDLLFRLIGDIIKVTETLIKAGEIYHKSLSADATENRKGLIHELLSSIANAGEGDADIIRQLEEHKQNHHSSFKGTC